MRKFTRFTLLLLLVIAVALPLAAHAEGSLEVTSTVTPEALEKAGKVNINVSLTNTADYMLEDVTLIARGIEETLGNFEPGIKKVYNITNFKVQEEEIGNSVAFTFIWLESGSPQSFVHNVPIAKKTAAPAMKAERTLSSNSGAAGDIITITYAIQNTGDVGLSNVTITDPVLASPISVGTVAEGEVKRVSEEITLAENVTSSPVITADGAGTPLSITIDPANITLTNANLTVEVTAGIPAATGTPVNIVVTNNGNVDFKSVALIDESGTALTTAFALAQSDTKTITVDIPVEVVRALTVTATATYGEGSGTPLIVTAQPVELLPYLSPEDVVITLIAKPIKSEFDEPTEVTFAIRIDNESPVPLYEFELSEAQDGRVLALATVDQGAQTVNVKIVVSESRDVVFSAVFKDEGGNAYSASATPVAITIAAPAASEEPVGDNGGASWLRWVLLIIIILLLAAAASLVYVLTQSRRRKEQEREADELDRMLASRQQNHRRETAKSTKIRDRDKDVADALIDQITGRTEKPRVPVRPRAEDLKVGEPPSRKPPHRTPEENMPPKKAPQDERAKPPLDDENLFDDEFN